MKHIHLTDQALDLPQVLEMAQESPVVIVSADGTSYMVALADDFDQEVTQLRESAAFQAFLDSRSAKNRPRRPLREIAEEIEADLAAQRPQE